MGAANVTRRVLSCNSDFELLRCEPRTLEEEEAQLDFVLKASSCNTMDQYVTVDEQPHSSCETESVSVDVGTETDTHTTERHLDESDAADVLMSLLNS